MNTSKEELSPSATSAPLIIPRWAWYMTNPHAKPSGPRAECRVWRTDCENRSSVDALRRVSPAKGQAYARSRRTAAPPQSSEEGMPQTKSPNAKKIATPTQLSSWALIRHHGAQ